MPPQLQNDACQYNVRQYLLREDVHAIICQMVADCYYVDMNKYFL